MEEVVIANADMWRGRSVMVTGHTGFKGGWLALWLHRLNACIHGYALNPPTNPSIFEVARIKSVLASDTRADLTNLDALISAFEAAQPEVVFHLAAQSLVRDSYRDPIRTYLSNIMGTANVMEACRASSSVRAIVVVTTDKVYQNREWIYPYRETDPLGGHDPYSASKAAAELVVGSYRASFFSREGALRRVATARAGNVLGGGDWAVDRLVPDCIRAFGQNRPACLRNPNAKRPWQHVLEPLCGYIKLAERLLAADGGDFEGAWNFGPEPSGDATVGQLAEAVSVLWGNAAQVLSTTVEGQLHEAGILRLDSSRAKSALAWSPRWDLQQTLRATVEWYQTWLAGEDMRSKCLDQINDFYN